MDVLIYVKGGQRVMRFPFMIAIRSHSSQKLLGNALLAGFGYRHVCIGAMIPQHNHTPIRQLEPPQSSWSNVDCP